MAIISRIPHSIIFCFLAILSCGSITPVYSQTTEPESSQQKIANLETVHCIVRFNPKCPGAMDCLAKDKDSMLAFYDYPAENWQYIRTTNPIESVFATVRLRTAKTKNCGSRITTLTMAFKLMETAQNK